MAKMGSPFGLVHVSHVKLNRPSSFCAWMRFCTHRHLELTYSKLSTQLLATPLPGCQYVCSNVASIRELMRGSSSLHLIDIFWVFDDRIRPASTSTPRHTP